MVKGVFRPSKPEKYRGDVSNIIYRSGYELTYMMWCDRNENVLEWASEEIVVRYRTRLDEAREMASGRPIYHRYYVDFYTKVRDAKGRVHKYLVEVKPHHETIAPTASPNKKKKTYLQEMITWTRNCDKWRAATMWAKQHDMEFKIVTEVELYGRRPR